MFINKGNIYTQYKIVHKNNKTLLSNVLFENNPR